MNNYKEDLKYILKETGFIEMESKPLTFNAFIENQLVKRAVERSLEIIGKTVKNIPPEILEKYPEAGWNYFAKTSDILITNYFEIDYTIIWDIIVNHIPILKRAAEQILSSD